MTQNQNHSLPSDPVPDDPDDLCHCFAVRSAARQMGGLYDRCLAAAGLTGNQYSMLLRLSRLGPLTINEFAETLGVDRTTMGRNIRPLEREGLVAVAPGAADRRRRAITVTPKGAERLKLGHVKWREAQRRVESAFGADRARELRAMLTALVACDLDAADGVAPAFEETIRAV